MTNSCSFLTFLDLFWPILKGVIQCSILIFCVFIIGLEFAHLAILFLRIFFFLCSFFQLISKKINIYIGYLKWWDVFSIHALIATTIAEIEHEVCKLRDCVSGTSFPLAFRLVRVSKFLHWVPNNNICLHSWEATISASNSGYVGRIPLVFQADRIFCHSAIFYHSDISLSIHLWVNEIPFKLCSFLQYWKRIEVVSYIYN